MTLRHFCPKAIITGFAPKVPKLPDFRCKQYLGAKVTKKLKNLTQK
jgi:hypothetical protein